MTKVMSVTCVMMRSQNLKGPNENEVTYWKIVSSQLYFENVEEIIGVK